MKFSVFKFIFLLFLFVAPQSAFSVGGAPEITVIVTLDRDTIGLDEQATLIVKVIGESQNLPAPQIPTLPMFEIYSQGSSTNISIRNGKISASHTYRYILIPGKAGRFPIEQISVVHKNKRYKGNTVELEVLKQGSSVSKILEKRLQNSSGSSKDYFLEASVDKKNPYVNEQVTLTLKFYIAVQYYGAPELVEPTTTGFWTEILGTKAPYYQVIGKKKYKVIERKYALFPTQVGDLTIGRATIKATVADRSKRYRDPFDMLGDVFGRGMQISASSKTLRVNVKPLPKEGRPKNFSGTIGSFKIDAIPDKRKVELNQPISVRFRIKGIGNIKSISEPVIKKMDDFRIYRASSSENISKVKDKLGGTKIYEEIFIPRRPGQLEIPAVTFNYFDPHRGKYRTIATKPIKIEVIKPEGYVVSPDVPYGSPGFTIGSKANEIIFIKEDIGRLRKIGEVLLLTKGYIIVNAIPVFLLAGTVLVRRRREKLAGNIGYARFKSAGKLAKKRLSKARSLATTEKSEEYFSEIYLVLSSYIADKLNISVHGITIDSMTILLTEKKAEEPLIDEIKEILQKAEFAKFAPSTISEADIAETLLKTEEVMVKLEGLNFA